MTFEVSEIRKSDSRFRGIPPLAGALAGVTGPIPA